MTYEEVVETMVQENGAERSTMMKTPCLRYQGAFIAMMFEKEDALIIKVAPERVDDLIANGHGLEFNFTKKKFKEWALIPKKFEDAYESYIAEALNYAKSKK